MSVSIVDSNSNLKSKSTRTWPRLDLELELEIDPNSTSTRTQSLCVSIIGSNSNVNTVCLLQWSPRTQRSILLFFIRFQQFLSNTTILDNVQNLLIRFSTMPITLITYIISLIKRFYVDKGSWINIKRTLLLTTFDFKLSMFDLSIIYIFK